MTALLDLRKKMEELWRLFIKEEMIDSYKYVEIVIDKELNWENTSR